MYGKTIFSWNVPEFHGGDPEKFVEGLVDAGFEGVLLKAADGPYIFKANQQAWPTWGENVRQELVTELRNAGLKVYLWHFVYGYDPKGELKVAVEQCRRFSPDGYVWDSEGAFDVKTAAVNNARFISRGLKVEAPDVRQALCWWALPRSPVSNVEWHPIRVAQAWLEICEMAMPMVYWQGSGGALAISYLHKSLTIWRSFTQKPIAPIGRAYSGDGGILAADRSGIKAFSNSILNSAEAMNLTGTSWWSLDVAHKNAATWTALKETPKFNVPVALPTDVILGRLMNHHRFLFPEVYPPQE